MSKTNKDQSPFHGIFEGCTKEQKTQLGVAHAVLHYTKLGYIVCFPPPDTQGVGWDLLACKPNGTPIKIQVKTTGQQVGKSGYYAVGLKDGHYAEDNDCMDGKTCRKTIRAFDELFALAADGTYSVWTMDALSGYKHSVHMKNSQAKLPLD